MRVLLAEDEKELNDLVRKTLEDEGYAVDSVFDGDSALEYLSSTPYDIALLDIMMPGRDGIAVLREYRKSGGKAPILILTARDAVEDRVVGLDAGADDYLVKPFDVQEVLLHIRALLRRSENSSDETTYPVTHASESGDAIIHEISNHNLQVGDKVICRINWPHRFDNMQRHCGEHLLSGAMYKLFGGVNRGFHMGEHFMTADINLEKDPSFE